MTRVNVQRWQEHVAAQAASDLTVAQYAQKHGLSKYTLYAARRQSAALKAKKDSGRVIAAQAKRSPFIAIRVAANLVALRACLPNGVTLEFGQVEASASTQLIGILAALPCSS